MKNKSPLLLFALAALAFPKLSAAQTPPCNTIAHGNWSNPAIWSCGYVPTGSNEVNLTGVSVTLDQIGVCLFLTMTGGSLTGATFNFFNNGNFYWQEGTINVLTFDQADDLFFQTAATKTFSGNEMTLHDEAYWQDGNVGGTGTFRVTDIASINAEHLTDRTFSSKIIVESGGELNKTSTSVSTFNGQVDFLTGSIASVSGGTLKLNASTGTFSGASIGIAAGATLEFAAGTHNLDNVAFTGSGKIKVSGATLNLGTGCTVASTLQLELTGGTLDDAVGLAWGSVTVSNGTYVGTGSPSASGNMNWSGGTLSGILIGASTFTVNGLLTLSGSTKTLSRKTLVAAGGSSWTAGQISGSTSNPAILRIPAATTFTVNLAASTNMQNGISLEVFGTLTKQGSTDCDVDGNTTFSNAALNVEAGNIAFAEGSMANTAASISAGATLECDGGTFNFNAGAAVAGAGTFKTTSPAVVNFNTGSSLGTALDLTSSQPFSYVPNLNLPSLSLGSSTNFSGSADVTVSGAMNWTGSFGTISGSGTITAAGTTTLSGSTKTFNTKTLLITGTANWPSGSLSGTGSTLRVAGGGVLNLEFTSTTNLTSFGKLDVLGTLNKNQSSVVTFNNEVDLTGATLNLNAGTLVLTVSGSVDNDYGSSSLNVTQGTVLKCTGSNHNFNAGTSVDGSGEFEVAVSSGKTATFNAGSSLSCHLRMESGGGTLTDHAGLTPISYVHTSGTYNGTGSPVVQIMDWDGGTVGGSGAFTVTSSLSITGAATNTLSGKTFILQGQGSWTAGNFNVTSNGVFRVAAGATLECNLPATKTFSGTAGTQFENLGTLTSIGGAAPNFSIPFAQTSLLNGNATVAVSGTLANLGNVAPGTSPGQLSLQTSTFDNTGGTLSIEIESDAGDGTGSDLLTVSGAAILGGTLTVTLLGGYLPPVGSEFVILTFASGAGTFTTTNLPVNPASWQVQYNATNVTLKVVAPLPLELIDFQGSFQYDKAVLRWRTASEFNTHEFSIERSADGRRFDVIGTLPAAGFSSEETSYSFTDHSPLTPLEGGTGGVYYRLKMSDLDGQFTFSPVIFLKRKTAGWAVFPTVFVHSVQVKFEEEGEWDLRLSDAAGRRVWSGWSGSGRLDFSFLPAGAYWLQASAGRIFTIKIIKLP